MTFIYYVKLVIDDMWNNSIIRIPLIDLQTDLDKASKSIYISCRFQG